MKKSFALEIKTTTSRAVNNLPETWQEVTVLDMPSVRHEWGTLDDGKISSTDYYNADMLTFTKEVLAPLATYLNKNGITVDFSSITRDVSVTDVLSVRKSWYTPTSKHTYVMLDEGTRQAERLERKNGMARFPYRAAKVTVNGKEYIVNTNTSAIPTVQKHTYLDLFALLRGQIEQCINATLRDMRKGHVKIQLTNVSSVSVQGSAN